MKKKHDRTGIHGVSFNMHFSGTFLGTCTDFRQKLVHYT